MGASKETKVKKGEILNVTRQHTVERSVGYVRHWNEEMVETIKLDIRYARGEYPTKFNGETFLGIVDMVLSVMQKTVTEKEKADLKRFAKNWIDSL